MGNFFSEGRVCRKRSMVGLLVAAVCAVFWAQLAWSGAANAAPVLQPCSASYIGVPGSGQSSTRSVEMDTLGTWVQVDSAKAGQRLRNKTLLSYPAVAWYHYVKPGLSFNWNGLGRSEAIGEAKLTALIKSDRAKATAAGCPNAPILIAGYSQGAEVVVRAIDTLSRPVRNTISVALLGNPSFTPKAAEDLDLNKSVYRGIRPSFLAGQRYTLKSDVISRTIDLCAASDPICAYHLSLVPGLRFGSAHYHYVTLTYKGVTLVHYAANFLWAHRAAEQKTTWTYSELPLPANAGGSTESGMYGVSCPSAAFCVAVGNYSDTADGNDAMLLTRSDGSWTAAEAPVPAGATGAGLSAVSCPSALFCVAVGYYEDGSGGQDPLLLTWSGGSWTPAKAPLPADSASPANASLDAVSCPSASFCVAGGNYTGGDTSSLMLTWSDGSWTATQPFTGHQGWLTGVSCLSASFCTAVGDYLIPTNTWDYQPEVLTWSGSAWAAAPGPIPSGVMDVTWSSVSCPSSSYCAATGLVNYDPSSFEWQDLVRTWSGGSWTETSFPEAPSLVDVSCWSAADCVVVGTTGPGGGNPIALASSG